MDHEFDKEIDALLRKAHRDGPVLVGDFAGSRHLDADEISAFAENAAPEKFRAMYTTHLADCDRCRKILSNVLVLNAEAAPAAASSLSAITIAEREMPWYKKLFAFPNLAYVMGSLVLIFGGFLAFTIVRNSSGNNVATSKMPESAASNITPSFQSDEYAANSANMSANAASDTTVMGMPANSNSLAERGDVTAGERGPLAGSEVRRDENFALDGADSSAAGTTAVTTQPPPPPPAALAAPKDVKLADRDDVAKEKVENKAGNLPTEPSKTDSMLKQEQYKGNATQSGPMRNSENQYNRQLENLERRREADKKVARGAAEEGGSAGRKVVGGRTFERKQGVWYDTAYAGRPTINVQRGTAEFNRLDSGLRSIANSLSGTIVVVWGAKAYRIQ